MAGAVFPERNREQERLTDLVESAFHYLRRNPGPADTRAERLRLLAHMERILAETPGVPRLPPPAPGRPRSLQEMRLLALVAQLDDGRGAAWEDVVTCASLERIPAEDADAALDALVHAGALYEPARGRLKRA
jgi:hypothetical protein